MDQATTTAFGTWTEIALQHTPPVNHHIAIHNGNAMQSTLYLCGYVQYMYQMSPCLNC